MAKPISPEEIEAESISPECISLYRSLLDAGWEKYHFQFAGPYPPYTRIGLCWDEGRLMSCFTSVVRDRFLLRTKRSFRQHFRLYGRILFTDNACEDAFGQNWVDETGFPANQWLKISTLTSSLAHPYFITVPDSGQSIDVPIHLFAMAGEVYLRRV